MKFIIIILSFFSVLSHETLQQNDAITVLNKTDFKKAINAQKVQLVDVRTPQEYAGGYIQNAVNADVLNQTTFLEAFSTLNKEEAVYIYCRSGNRSQKAAQKLDSLGFKKIFDLEGGYMNWN
ncbi:MAG: rhodanese-like domain-containing protein [Dokdonia sp.]|jgi:rhodanese-related sulfurtransferase